MKQEELGFYARVHDVSQFCRFCRYTLQGETRVSEEWRFVRLVYIADEPSHTRLCLSPREDPEGLEIGLEQHVAFFDPNESLDRGSVEHDLAGKRFLELARGNLNILGVPEDVGEREP